MGQLLADFDDGKLSTNVAAPEGLSALLAQRDATPLTWKHWQNIDAEERRRGAETGRPRMKFVDIAEMLTAAL
jgi:ferredoxin--NADP+ reductase